MTRDTPNKVISQTDHKPDEHICFDQFSYYCLEILAHTTRPQKKI